MWLGLINGNPITVIYLCNGFNHCRTKQTKYARLKGVVKFRKF